MYSLTTGDEQNMREGVDLGAKTLDEHRPGWHRTVQGAMTSGLFNMRHWETCMAGTLEMLTYVDRHGRKVEDRIAFNGLSVSVKEADDYGFDVPSVLEGGYVYDEAYAMLDQLWAEKVDERIAYDALNFFQKMLHRISH
jgi:hypothetical protein